MSTTENEAHQKARELNIDSDDIKYNTNLWAHAIGDKPASRLTIEVGDIETN